MTKLIGFDKPQNSLTRQKTNKIFEQIESGEINPSLKEIFAMMREARPKTLVIKDTRIELTLGDLMTIANQRSVQGGYLPPFDTMTHDVIIQRAGCKRLIKLTHADKIIIQGSF